MSVEEIGKMDIALDVTLWGTLAVILGLPVAAWVVYRKRSREAAARNAAGKRLSAVI